MLPWYSRIWRRLKWQTFETVLPIVGGFFLAQAIVSGITFGPSFFGF